MTISKQLMAHIEQLQAKANSSFERYPEHQCILPNDAIYLFRVTNLQAVFKLIEQMVESGHSLETVLQKSIAPNLGEICNRYPHIQEALEVIIRDFGGKP